MIMGGSEVIWVRVGFFFHQFSEISLWCFWCLTGGDLYGRRPPDHFLGLLSRACRLGSIGTAGIEVCNCRDRRWISEQSRTLGEVQLRRNGWGAFPGTEGDRR